MNKLNNCTTKVFWEEIPICSNVYTSALIYKQYINYSKVMVTRPHTIGVLFAKEFSLSIATTTEMSLTTSFKAAHSVLSFFAIFSTYTWFLSCHTKFIIIAILCVQINNKQKIQLSSGGGAIRIDWILIIMWSIKYTTAITMQGHPFQMSVSKELI